VNSALYCVVVVAVEGGRRREAQLAVVSGFAASAGWRVRPRGGGRRRRRRALTNICRVNVVVWSVRSRRVIINICLVNQGNVVDQVIDEEFWRRHEFMDGVPGSWLLDAVIKRATEHFRHSDSQAHQLHWRELREWE
jgi:hypothetical protein